MLMYYFWICLTFYGGQLVYPHSKDQIQPFLQAMWDHIRVAGNWTVLCTDTRVRGILSLTLATRLPFYCKNIIQLRTFGEVQVWLETYFLEPSAGSYIQHDMQLKSYPRDSTDNKFALWLLCLLGTSSRYHHCDVTHIRIFVLDADKTTFSTPSNLYTEILRSYAIGVNRVCLYSCSNSIPSSLRRDISIP
jgi:hypothetical protein